MSRIILPGISLLLLIVVGSCSILKKEDPEKKVRDFLAKLQHSVSSPDDVVLEYFDVNQSRQSLLSLITLLKNSAHENIVCEIDYTKASVTADGELYKVDLNARFFSTGLEHDYKAESSITLWLTPRNQSFVITKLNAEEFYQSFTSIKHEMQWSVERANEIVARDTIYALARAMEQRFDSVIWYSIHDNHNFFYVISGSWSNYFQRYGGKPETNHKMGLVDVHGEIVIPIEYDLIGTIGFDLSMIVEVRIENKVGYFDIEKRSLVVPAMHDIIIPYNKNDIFCIVKNDSTYGWYDNVLHYTLGFPTPELERWVKNFEFLPRRLQLDEANYAFCEIPVRDQAGYGIIMPPSYLVRTGIFPEIEGGISTTDVPLNGWTDYVETEGTFYQTVTESISALVTSITEHYIDGREDFYTHNKLIFIGPLQDTLSVNDLHTGGAITIRRIGSDLIEVKHVRSEDYMFEEEDVEVTPSYSYYRLPESLQVERLNSDRKYPETEFVKLDSSYLKGGFKHFDEGSQQMVSTQFLTKETLITMRDEILAVYGFDFHNEPEKAEYFSQFSWYKAEYSSIDIFRDDMSETDQYNLGFLEKVIVAMEALTPVL